jgi:hypothetical protein
VTVPSPWAAITTWYERERAQPVSPSGNLIMGGLLYGPVFLDIFQRFSLPTILAEQNRTALARHGATSALYTDAATEPALERLLVGARIHGIDAIARVVPEEVIQHPSFWARLATAQSLWCQRAARAGGSYHMFMPDQSYDATYFPNLLRLGTRHRRIAHLGLNVNMTAAPDLEMFRDRDGVLTIPTRCLTDIAWKHLHWRMNRHILNNAKPPDKMPNCHFQTWRARDRLIGFSPHCNPAFMDAETCRQLDLDGINHTTLDAQISGLFKLDFYVPTFEDGMSYIGIEYPGRSREDPSWPVYIGMDDFIARCCAETRHRPEYLVYYQRPHEIPASIDPLAPEAEEVMVRQMELVGLMRQRLHQLQNPEAEK